MPQVEEPNDKVREQIEEILEKDASRKNEPIRIAKPVAPRKVRVGTPIWYPTPEKLIVLGLVLMLIAAIGRQFVLPLTLAGFALAGVGYYMVVVRRRRAKYGSTGGGFNDTSPKYWRGKPVKPSGQVKKRDGNILEFPGASDDDSKRRFRKKG